MATTRKPLGSRVTVAVGSKGKGKDSKTYYSYMLKSTADLFGFKVSSAPKAKERTVNGKKVEGGLLRGSIGAGSVKIPIGKPVKTKAGSYRQKYVQIPIPVGVTNSMVKSFLQKATKNKPEKFVSKDGRTYPVTVKK